VTDWNVPTGRIESKVDGERRSVPSSTFLGQSSKMTQALQCDGFERVKELLRRRFGLDAAQTGGRDFVRAVRRQMRRAGAATCEQYCRLLESADGEKHLDELIADVAVGETYFFRHPGQFRALVQCVFPWLRSEKSQTNPGLRIWSAGCSTGEEAYSLAWTAWTACRQWTVSIEVVGTDVSEAALERARRARYGRNSLRGLSRETVRQFLVEEQPGVFRPVEPARRLVRFERLNLVSSEVDRMRNFDVIFCRNVLIYFEQSVRQRVLRSLHRSLRDGGYLFVSPTEGFEDEGHFATVRAGEVFFYRKVPVDETANDPARPLDGASDGPLHNASPRGPVPTAAASDCLGRRAEQGSPRSPANLSASRRSRSATDQLGQRPTVHSNQPSARKAGGSAAGRRTGAPSPEPSDRSDRSQLARRLWTEAVHEFAQERAERAGHLVERLLELEPENVRGWLLRALVLAGQGLEKQAADCCRRALSLEPCHAEAHFVHGLLLDAQGQTDRALDELQKAVFLDSNFAPAAFRLACLLQREGRSVAAERVFRSTLQALEHDTDERLLLYGGGFSRDALRAFCQARLAAANGWSTADGWSERASGAGSPSTRFTADEDQAVTKTAGP